VREGSAGARQAAGLAAATTLDVDRSDHARRAWTTEAVRRVRADAHRSADTHLLRFPLPDDWGVDLYLKDESTHPTGSLKHRLASSLFLYALCNGRIAPGRPVIEASSGSTAVSEAYFAALIGVPFIAVVPRTTSRAKQRLIEEQGGRCHLVDSAADVHAAAVRLAAASGGHYMDQFTYAERATDWRGNNSIAESLFHQLDRERHPEPEWIVATAGTGGTSATLARYVRYTMRATRICVADPENSAFFDGWLSGDPGMVRTGGSRIEGIGRPRMEPSFLPDIIDRMMRVPDAASIAALRLLERLTGRRAGGSTGTGLWAALRIAAEMRAAGREGSVATLICDPGDRYLDTYYADSWVAAQGLAVAPYQEALDRLLATGAIPA
jgi:cysteine synthase A